MANLIKKFSITSGITVALLVMSSAAAYAVRDPYEYFSRPQVGVWFGPIAPVFETSRLVDTALGGGLFLRVNTPLSLLKLGLDSSYQHYKSRGVNEITLVPVYANALFLLPIDIPLRFQLKAGVGACYVYVKPDGIGQWDPMFMLGAEVSFPAGRIVNIGLRFDYHLIYETYLKEARHNGHFIDVGIMVYFNI